MKRVSSFYRKYRPQTAADLDITLVREFFTRIIDADKVSHAYLFTGPRGTGKTSAARILAKIVNCEKNVKSLAEPCGECVRCRAITSGSMVDLIEIDAASNRGIDDIRDLREKIRLAPAGAAYKVYIIDEVHMLTDQAFNALLKTLEEPPPHGLFVLATTEAHKVPETIKSRCVALVFPKATQAEVMRSLAKAVAGEKLDVAAGVIEEIAGAADGSFREGMKTLEQLSLAGGKITLVQAQREVGTGGQVSPETLVALLEKRNLAGAIAEIGRLANLGVNWRVYLTQVLAHLRQQLLAKVGVKPEVPDTGGAQTRLSDVDLLALIDLLAEAGQVALTAQIPQLPLELVVVKWCGVGQRPRQESRSGTVPEPKPKPEPEPNPEPETRSGTTAGGSEDVVKRWEEVLMGVRPKNHSVEGLLRATRPTAVSGGRLQVEVFYQFHLDQLRQEKFLQIVEEEVRRVFASNMKLEYYLGKKQAREIVENLTQDVDQEVIKLAEEVFGKEG